MTDKQQDWTADYLLHYKCLRVLFWVSCLLSIGVLLSGDIVTGLLIYIASMTSNVVANQKLNLHNQSVVTENQELVLTDLTRIEDKIEVILDNTEPKKPKGK